MVDYDRPVVLRPKGRNPKTVPLSSIEVPDAWHLAMYLMNDLGEREGGNPLKAVTVDPDQMRQAGQMVLDLWHLCNDFRRNLAGDVEKEET